MIILLYWQELETSECNVAKLAAFAGVEVRLVNLSEGMVPDGTAGRNPIPHGACIIARATTLVRAAARTRSGDDGARLLTSVASKCLVYGFESNAEHNHLLATLSEGALRATESLSSNGEEFNVALDTREICRQFAGLVFGAARPESDFVFVEGPSWRGCWALIRIAERPFLVATKRRHCELLLLACREVADVDQVVAAGASAVPYFSRLVPMLMFLQRACGDRCWHGDSPRACLILDDPLLRKQYGFLDFEALLELMERKHFSTSIAFIPWNYRRSERRTVELFQKASHRYSLCVHGCDHTKAEFGSRNGRYLLEQSRNALHRMQRHGEMTGLAFDKVMVFPQGHFSTAAMEALKTAGYVAAVNSTPYPVDFQGGMLQLKDLLTPAITRFAGFPLFVRRYPNDIPALAFDLFLGKPALLVEHHGYFRNGYQSLAETIEKLNAMEPRLEWNSLSTICSRACLQKRTGDRDCHVQFYTDEFSIRNDSENTRHFLLSRSDVAADSVNEVWVNRVSANFEADSGRLNIRVSLGRREAAEIQITRPMAEAACSWQVRCPSIRVFLRRVLSEFRDNYVERSELLRRVAAAVRSRVVQRNRLLH